MGYPVSLWRNIHRRNSGLPTRISRSTIFWKAALPCCPGSGETLRESKSAVNSMGLSPGCKCRVMSLPPILNMREIASEIPMAGVWRGMRCRKSTSKRASQKWFICESQRNPGCGCKTGPGIAFHTGQKSKGMA